MRTTRRTLPRLRTRQTRKSRAAIIRSGATESEMRKMVDLRKRGAATTVSAGPARTRTLKGEPLRLRRGTAAARSGRLVPAGEADREARVLRRGRERLREREKGRPTPGADRKTSLE